MPESFWDEKTEEEIAEVLSHMAEPVRLLLFVEGDGCAACGTQQDLLEALADLSDELTLEIYNLQEHRQAVEEHAIDKFPATVPAGEKDYGIRYFGLTAGQEFASLLQTIVMISTGRSGLEPELEALVRRLQAPVHVQVFVTLTCPYCPRMVHTAHQFAYLNDHIEADMVESSQFLDLARRYQVEGVPRTIINETTVLDGAHPAPLFYLAILQAVDPEEYQQIEGMIREAEGLRRVAPLEEGHVYDVLIVGGGPAALSAALYAARKDLDVGLVAKKIGGQLAYTAQIENYLGLPGVTGRELLQRFQFHAESYPLAELVGSGVIEVEEAHGGFLVYTGDGREFAAQSVIYCAGKEYVRLGVPKEERFLGRGIAFCATCDAPLYGGRRVAVVGGGNSAFTAVRDLLGFASQVHLIHRRETFTADAALVEGVRGDPKLVVHTPYEVRSFVGDERLTGIEIQSLSDGETETLDVEGVFLEIGLSPNTGPVKGLLELSERGEVGIRADGSTALPGFFAAGDVTDVPEKQISVAVGQGALAALAAYEYLVEHEVVARRPELEADWV
ncbi:MAG: protein disulfide oxidoreductase [Chloroflexota bacterium]